MKKRYLYTVLAFYLSAIFVFPSHAIAKVLIQEDCLYSYNAAIAHADAQYHTTLGGCVNQIIGAWLLDDPTGIDINCAMDAYWTWYGAYDVAALTMADCMFAQSPE